MLVFVALTGLTQAQENAVILNWNAPTVLTSGDVTVPALHFDGAYYNLPGSALPHLMVQQDMSGRPARFEVVLENTVYESLTAAERKTLGNVELPPAVEVRPTVGWSRKQPRARIELIPLRRNPSTGQVEKLTSFTWKFGRVEAKAASARQGKSRSWAAQSALATGNWFRVGVTEDGLYKLDRNALSDLGLGVGSLDPRTLKVYGGGGGMVPPANDDPRVDDLQELAIVVQGEADGSLDGGDYILFYAEGPGKWNLIEGGNFEFEKNSYCDTNYYYVSAGGANGKRVASLSDDPGTPTHTVNQFVDYVHHENDWTNLVGSGREWFGEYFDVTPSYNFTFNFPNLVTVEPVWVKARSVARSSSNTNIQIRSNNGAVPVTMNFTGVSSSPSADYVKEDEVSGTYNNSNPSNIILSTIYTDNGIPGSIAWLDYLAVNVVRDLEYYGNYMRIAQPDVIGSGNLAQYTMTAASGATVWEVSDPLNAGAVVTNSGQQTVTWQRDASALRQYIAFNGSNFPTPALFGSVDNQNLHGLPVADMFIVAPKPFLEEAQRLADFHAVEDDMTVTVVTPQQIYHEFGSGKQDPSAIRDFMRMFYERATTPEDLPKHLLLFGDCSYDYKDVLNDNTNLVATYQSVPSFSLYESFCTDDYFGCLDPDEGERIFNDVLDLSVGRLTVKNVSEARTVVDKIIRYYEEGSYGDWTQRVLFVADDVDEGWETVLMGNADRLAVEVDTLYPELNVLKLYSDAYTQVTSAAGEQYPEVMDELRNQIERGVLLINYVGHGGEVGWASEGILNVNDVRSYQNIDKLNVMLTITCEFSRMDDPNRVSAGEYALLNPDGTSVALFSTMRVVFVGPADVLNNLFYDYAFEKDANGEDYTFGEIMRFTKNGAGTSQDRRRFGLLGDPAMRFHRPEYSVNVSTINQTAVSAFTDTLSALSKVEVSGTINDLNGQLVSDFNGILNATVFDKFSALETLDNNGAAAPIPFIDRQNTIYKGKASVVNGQWSYEFVVPIDIAYQIDFGKLSHYALQGKTDAVGAEKSILIGGTSDDPLLDDEGPRIELYMNDEAFVFGGITDENPDIFALLYDSLGINVVGNGIGHDLISVIDRESSSPIVLNDFYEADVDDFTRGNVRYPLQSLSPGRHHLYMKAYDVANNSAEAETEFVVAESANLALDHVLNYPNPFTTYTEFHFEHNRPAEPLEVQVQIFTVSGKLVKTLNANVTSDGFRVVPVTWDGLDEYGDEIGRGVYVYRVKVRSMIDNSSDEKYEKLVILR